MAYFNCFNVVKLVTDEASKQFLPLFNENSLKLSRLKSQCDCINKIASQYNGISCEIEIDSITMEISIMLTLADKPLPLSSINCPQPIRSEIFLNEENLICLIIINALIKVIFDDNWKPFIILVIVYLFCSFIGSLS